MIAAMIAVTSSSPRPALPARFGTRYELDHGRVIRICDADGTVHAELSWAGSTLHALTVPGAVVHGEVIDDPLLGPAHRVSPADGGPGQPTTLSAIKWDRPDRIPAIAAHGRLAPGAAPALLNALAVLAAHAGVTALRYAGPYPTSALYRALLRSFSTTATEHEFTADAMDRALRRARDALPFEFAPCPHERRGVEGGWVELRERITRAVLGGIVFDRGAGIGRLVPIDGAPQPAGDERALRCELWFAAAPYAEVARLSAAGQLLHGPVPPPAYRSPVLGREFPQPLRGALAELVADVVPRPLADPARALVARSPLVRADLAGRAAAATADGFAVHGVLWDRLAPHGLARVALALAEARAPVIAAAAVEAADRVGSGSSGAPMIDTLAASSPSPVLP